ncbi:hypothetical protein [Flavobacterium sp.]|uniref:hypothetical protein n=1 Tax=Flavobacterium sp. TaxID=239 RepID=UPI003D6A1DC7
MVFLNIEIFAYQKTLIVALIGAIIGQSLILIISWGKRKIDLCRKKQMIITDLNNHDKILDSLSEKYAELNNLFDKKEIDQFTTSIFHNLQLDIYQSVPKNELYSIFKKDLHVLVEIYKSIEFLKENGPYWIYKDYLEKSEQHLQEKENEPNHILLCNTELGFIDITQKNINNNLKTIKETKTKINKILR